MVRDAVSADLSDEDGQPVHLELRPPLTTAEIDAFSAELPTPLPTEVRELLELCSGFEGGAADYVDFTGRDCSFEYEPAFPHGVPIAADGFGNFWIVDLLPDSKVWGPIYFACHDAPVILYQSHNLEDFLLELIKCSQPPHESLINEVHDDRLFHVWRKNPGVESHEACLASADPALRVFAQELSASFQVIDLRGAQIGFGFSWGRYGPNTVVRRFGNLPIFAYEKPKSLLGRLFS